VVVAAATVLALRVGVRAPAALIGLASAWGLIFSVWAVILAPSIAASVPEKRRPAAFSIFFSAMLSMGIAGNWIGGHLTLWVHGNQKALLMAAAAVLAAVVPAWRWRPQTDTAAPSAPGRIWPRGPFLKRYLAAYAVWHLATGAFNPFHNVYFARLGFSAARIGSLFSATQLLQLVSLSLAPLFIRRAGLVGAIMWMMAATALGLFGLAGGTGVVLAYAWYVCLQWMSEPGLNTLLMDKVTEAERNGASSLNYLVAFGAQAVAAFAAGHLFTSLGYRPVLAGAGALALIAAGMFRLLLGGNQEPQASPKEANAAD
jgi:predicted MFS family arabinose efflux permease